MKTRRGGGGVINDRIQGYLYALRCVASNAELINGKGGSLGIILITSRFSDDAKHPLKESDVRLIV